MTSIDSAVQEFLLGCEAEGLKETTLRWYRSILGTFSQRHAATPVRDMTTHDLRVYLVNLRKLEYSPDTVGDYTRALHRFWKWAAAEYNIPNPMRTIRYPQPPKPKAPKAVELDTVIAMFKAAEGGMATTRDQAILSWAMDTGTRTGSIVTLKVSDIDFERRKAVVVEKGSKTRTVVFSRFTHVLLLRWMEQRAPADVMFYSLQTLEELNPNSLFQLFRRLARRAGVKGRFNPHSFRHFFGKEYALAGGDLYTLARIFGDDIKTIAAHYAIFTDNEVAAAHEKYSPVNKLAEKIEGKK